MTSPFAITSPSPTLLLAENRMGKMPFTVANMTDQTLSGRVVIVPEDDAPASWFKVIRGAEVNLPPGSSAPVLVQVEPPLGVAAARHVFRLDVVDPANPELTVPGPRCAFEVPPSKPTFSLKTPRGYLATLLGAAAGGALGELMILLSFRAPGESDCGDDVGCAFGDVFAYAIFLILAFVAGLVLLWIGSVFGAWLSLRARDYLGAKTTALFLAILMVPWTFAMLWLLNQITDNIVVVMILAPILLTAVPGVLARGAVLLIRTKRI